MDCPLGAKDDDYYYIRRHLTAYIPSWLVAHIPQINKLKMTIYSLALDEAYFCLRQTFPLGAKSAFQLSESLM